MVILFFAFLGISYIILGIFTLLMVTSFEPFPSARKTDGISGPGITAPGEQDAAPERAPMLRSGPSESGTRSLGKTSSSK